MKKYLLIIVVIATTIFLINVQILRPVSGQVLEKEIKAPEFTHSRRREWINSEPLQLADLKGHVVMVDFWTFECWNCYRSFPWLTAMEHRLEPRGFRIIGVHSPEFEREKIRNSIAAKVAEFKLEHPVMIDNDHSYWRAMGNRFWPAYYIIDKKGYVRAVFYGETHAGDRQAGKIERIIEELLDEPGS